MNLLIDIGNSRLKWALDDGDDLRVGGSAILDASVDTIAQRLWHDLSRPDRVVVSNVKGQATERALTTWGTEHWNIEPLFVRPNRESHGVVSKYRDPEQLCSDRWAAVIGARSLEGAPLCVVDCGTAVTVDGINDTGEFVGGVILPGLRLARECLSQSTAEIGDVVAEQVAFPGESTQQAVHIGAVFAVVGGIERSIAEFRRLLGDHMVVYLTGGDAAQIGDRLSITVTHHPELVLRGLAVIAGS